MSNELSGEMEKRITEAATRVFIKKGSAGASMQDIADEAGINRTLLNYYFRNKEKLFELVFAKVTECFLPGFISTMRSSMDIFDKFRGIIDIYFDLLLENPLFPIFIIHEISADPSLLIKLMKQKGLNPDQISQTIQDEMKSGKIKDTDPRNLMVNLLGLIIFPFAARPLIEGLLFHNNSGYTMEFIENRREYLKEYFIESIRK